MAREYEEYRDVLARLLQNYGNADEINLAEYARRNNTTTPTLRKKYNLPPKVKSVDITLFARQICKHGIRR